MSYRRFKTKKKNIQIILMTRNGLRKQRAVHLSLHEKTHILNTVLHRILRTGVLECRDTKSITTALQKTKKIIQEKGGHEKGGHTEIEYVFSELKRRLC